MEASPPPQHESKGQTTNQKPHRKGQPRDKRPRPQNKNQYQYNPDLIDENTLIPPLPKKGEILPKTDIKLFKEREKKSSARIEEIINKKKEIRAQKFKFNRQNQNKGNVNEAHQNQFGDYQELKDKMATLKIERNKLGDELHDAIQQAKANNEKLKSYRQGLKGSRQNFIQRLRHLEHIQTTKDLNKNQERDVNNEINGLKRKIKQAQSSGNIEIKLEQAEDLKEQLDDLIASIRKQKDPIDKQFAALDAEYKVKKGKIADIREERNVEKTEKTEEKERHDKEYEAWKETKKERLDKLQADIVKIKEDNSKLWDEFHAKQDQYWKQKQYIDFLEWQNRVKNRKIGDKEKEARKAEYEKRDQDRERDEKLRKYLGEIQSINFLINYLKGLKKSNTAEEEADREVKVSQEEVAAKLKADAQWKKQKGLEVLQSKKSKEDEEPEKKSKKKSKKKQENKKQEQKFLIPYNVEVMFEGIRIEAPTSVEEIEKKIQELKERQGLFERVAKEESTEEEKVLAEGIKDKGGKGKAKKEKLAKKSEDDFPTI